MRQQMIESCDALLALGGRRTGYLGKYPGIVEEAYLALRVLGSRSSSWAASEALPWP